MVPEREVAVRLGFILLAGCPQLLDDEFVEGSFASEVPDASDALGVGGSGGDGSGGSHAGGSGTTGPEVVSVFPANGARGVAPDVELVFTFSASMDTSSVEAAYVSGDLPAQQVSFTWSEGDTVLRVRPRGLLQVNSGSDPATVTPANYALDLTARAKDKAGRALVAKHVNFTVVRSITEELGAVQNRDLTGNWRTDGSYGSNYCERADTTICMGDGVSTYKGFVTFQLDELPADVVSISSAALSSTIQQIFGDPFAVLGALKVEHVAFGNIGADAFSAPALAAPRNLSTSAAAAESVSADVVAEVRADWGTRARSQFRLFFDAATNSDAVADQVVCDWSSAHLTLTYLAP